jgi:ABC-type Fe3+-siderophore transport system permease subunit
MNWYAFGGTWEGVPFGTDATDNKTQLLFVYLIFAMLATWGSFRGSGRDLFAPKTLGVIGLGTFAVMLFTYLIPHSIQFEATFTYAFCYTWTAIVAALYLLGRLRTKTTG